MTGAVPLKYVKINGLGNEIVIVDLRGVSKTFTQDEVRAVAAARDTQFDQMMVLHTPKTPGTEAYVRIYNADGSEAGACGNGMRCVGWWMARGRANPQFKVKPRRACSTSMRAAAPW